MAGMDQNRMIRSKELHVMLREVVADGGGGAILASAGFDQAEPKIVSAIAAHVWAHVALVPTKYPQVGDLRTMLFDVEGGTLVLGELLEASHFVCLYSKKEYGEPLSDLFARLAALQQKLAEMCGDALSGRPDDSPEAGAAALDADA